jgi:putative redox protein
VDGDFHLGDNAGGASQSCLDTCGTATDAQSPKGVDAIRWKELMLEVDVNYLDAVQFAITARQHTVLCDQPEKNGGSDEGMTPPELLLASVGSCAAFYAVAYLKKRNLQSAGMRVKVQAEKVAAPARLDNFLITVEAPIPLAPEHMDGMRDAVYRCLIRNTLLHPPQSKVEVRQPERPPDGA